VLSTAVNELDQDYANINAPAFASAVGVTSRRQPASGRPKMPARTPSWRISMLAANSWVPSDAPPGRIAAQATDMKNAMNFVRSNGATTGNLGD
jgi:hypothetical protein